jgi:DNA-binding PadR family transcriptional regulator
VYLEIIVLSMLRHGPAHGYELKQQLRRVSLDSPSNNSLYPTLRRFERNGVASKTVQSQPGRPQRNVYAITEHGLDYFHSMISQLPTALAGNEEEFLGRVAFFGELTFEERRAILDARDAALAERIAALRALDGGPTRTADRRWRNETTKRYIAVIEAERGWIAGLAQKIKRRIAPIGGALLP